MLSAHKDAERRFLEELNARGVRYTIVGLFAAIIRVTVIRDIDLWFATISDPQIAPAHLPWAASGEAAHDSAESPSPRPTAAATRQRELVPRRASSVVMRGAMTGSRSHPP